MFIKKIFLFFLLFFCGIYIKLSAQNQDSISVDIAFSNYLFQNNMSADAIAVIDSALKKVHDSEQKDSLWYYRGFFSFEKKQVEKAAESYHMVSQNSVFYRQSVFFNSYSNTYLGEYKKSLNILNNYPVSDSLTFSLLNLEKAGILLLQRNLSGYDSISSYFKNQYFHVAESEFELNSIRKKIAEQKHRSPFLAGTLSAVVPGLGKIYAGKAPSGISSFLQCALLGAIMYESGKKAGINSARFIISSTAFSVFYIGNIWGSALAVSVRNQEFNNDINNQILFHMRIPLRNVFN